MRKRMKVAAFALLVGAATATGGITAPAAFASGEAPAAVSDSGDIRAAGSGSADRTLWTSNRAGQINIHWDWKSSADGKSYYGSFWGKFYDHKKDGKYVLLQAKWKGQDWTTIRTAANGEDFRGDYSKLNGLNFRACLQGGNCGAPAW
ncbi:hypothetical protein ACFVXC_37965 [Streptomyces sp. NPDC058257]|uniref:hypothetical protein n=1 Tax=Streptomyces sp. NPDC058257 TaxID=3346409 RepID=UPI0036E9FD90